MSIQGEVSIRRIQAQNCPRFPVSRFGRLAGHRRWPVHLCLGRVRVGRGCSAARFGISIAITSSAKAARCSGKAPITRFTLHRLPASPGRSCRRCGGSSHATRPAWRVTITVAGSSAARGDLHGGAGPPAALLGFKRAQLGYPERRARSSSSPSRRGVGAVRGVVTCPIAACAQGAR